MKRLILLALLALSLNVSAQDDLNGFGDVSLSTYITDSTFLMRLSFTGAYYDGGQHLVDSVKVGDYYYQDCSPYIITAIDTNTAGILRCTILSTGNGGQPTLGGRATIFRSTPSLGLLRGTVSGNDNYGIPENEFNCIRQSLITQLDQYGQYNGDLSLTVSGENRTVSTGVDSVTFSVADGDNDPANEIQRILRFERLVGTSILLFDLSDDGVPMDSIDIGTSSSAGLIAVDTNGLYIVHDTSLQLAIEQLDSAIYFKVYESDGVTVLGDGSTINKFRADTSTIATIKAVIDSIDARKQTLTISDFYVSNDTLYLITEDSTYFALLPDGADDWGTQTVQKDSTLRGDGTAIDPLRVNRDSFPSLSSVASKLNISDTTAMLAPYAQGSGTANFFPVWTGTRTLGRSILQQPDTNHVSLSTKPIKLGTWTTAGQPATPAQGWWGYNTTNNTPTWYTGTGWNVPAVAATGTGLFETGQIPYGATSGLTTSPLFRSSIGADFRMYINSPTPWPGSATSIFGVHSPLSRGNILSLFAPTASSGQVRELIFSAATNSMDVITVSGTGVSTTAAQIFTSGFRFNGLRVNNNTYLFTTNTGGSIFNLLGMSTTSNVLLGSTDGGWGDMRILCSNNSTAKIIFGRGASVLHGTIDSLSRWGLNRSVADEILHVGGKIKIDTLSDNAASLAGLTNTSGDGVITRLKLGTGLSLSNDTINNTVLIDDIIKVSEDSFNMGDDNQLTLVSSSQAAGAPQDNAFGMLVPFQGTSADVNWQIAGLATGADALRMWIRAEGILGSTNWRRVGIWKDGEDAGSVDVSASGDNVTFTQDTNSVNTVAIVDNAVTLAKVQTISTNRILGNDSGSSAAPSQLVAGNGVQLSNGSVRLGGHRVYSTSTSATVTSEIDSCGQLVVLASVASGASADLTITLPNASSSYLGREVMVYADDKDDDSTGGVDYNVIVTTTSGTYLYYGNGESALGLNASYEIDPPATPTYVKLICVIDTGLNYKWVVLSY